MLLYSLYFEDNNDEGGRDYLIDCATRLDEKRINNAIKSFMLDCAWSKVNRYIHENNYNDDWRVWIIDNGLKLENKSTNQYVTWNIYDYDEDYVYLQSKVINFLKLQSTTK